MRKLTHEEILKRQAEKLNQPGLPFCVVLNNIRSLYNVGSIFRTADGAGLEKIWLCGITGKPPQPGLIKTSLGAEERISWEYRNDVIGVLKELKSKGYQILLLEQIEGSVPYQEFVPRSPVCLVIGNEISGISEDILSLSDAAIEIEMSGIKNSLNVSVAFGIVSYHIRNCLLKYTNVNAG